MKKFLTSAILASTIISTSAIACTTIIVGKKASKNGSVIVGRNEDGSQATNAVNYIRIPAKKHGYLFIQDDFSYQMPDNLLSHTATPDFSNNDSYQEAGFNDADVSMSATETIYSNKKVLAIDPYVKTGITENAMVTVILPQIHSPREGVKLLGKIIEEKGSAEGFGVVFSDNNEAWYLENAGGHEWVAIRIPDDKYFVSANQSRIGKIDFKDHKNFMYSKGLKEFAIKHNLYKPNKENLVFRKVFGKNTIGNTISYDTIYNHLRVKTIQKLFNPNSNIKTKKNQNDFPTFLKPEHKLSIFDVQDGLSNYYQETENDPYTSKNINAKYRPISVFRTQASHILEERNNLPKEIADIMYLDLGMTALGFYVPFYYSADIPQSYLLSSDKADNSSAFWKFRKLQTLAMTNFPKYAPIVQSAFKNLREQIQQNRIAFEKKYLSIYKENPKKAKQLLNEFTIETIGSVYEVTDNLTNKIFTDMTKKINKAYSFHGA